MTLPLSLSLSRDNRIIQNDSDTSDSLVVVVVARSNNKQKHKKIRIFCGETNGSLLKSPPLINHEISIIMSTLMLMGVTSSNNN